MEALLSQRDVRRAANAIRWSPDAGKNKLLGSNWGQFAATFAALLKSEDERVALGACNLYAAIAGMTGTTSRIIIELNQKLGVRNEDELRELVDMGRTARRNAQDATFTIEQCYADAMELLMACVARRPELGQAAVERLGAARVAEVAAPAEEPDGVSGNGRGNGRRIAATNGDGDGV